jgi:enterochelin esterase-like enzyme
MKLVLTFLFCAAFVVAADPEVHPVEQLVNAARGGPAVAGLSEMAAKTLSPHGGVAVWGQEYLFITDLPFGASQAAVSASQAAVAIDGQPPLAMDKVPGSPFWMRLVLMRVGVTHAYQYVADGKPIGRRFDVPGYNPLSYPKAGIAKGILSEKHTLTSKIYDGMKVDFWWYASPGVDRNTPAPLMVWQDGQGLIRGDLSMLRLFTVTENLVAEKRIPPMIHILVAPGFAPDGKPMRSVEYDTVSDRYPRFLLEEIFPEVEKEYKLRPDAYSRGIAGESSGGISSFDAAWFMPDKFSRVHSTIGSFTSIQWHPEDKQEGGYIFPFMVRKMPKRNIRVWMSDGTDDLENDHGSWPLQNIELANSLKMREYDYHFRFGLATHDSAQAALDLPESLSWLWRDYDPAKTSQEYTLEPAEKDKPYYRVKIDNRDSW